MIAINLSSVKNSFSLFFIYLSIKNLYHMDFWMPFDIWVIIHHCLTCFVAWIISIGHWDPLHVVSCVPLICPPGFEHNFLSCTTIFQDHLVLFLYRLEIQYFFRGLMIRGSTLDSIPNFLKMLRKSENLQVFWRNLFSFVFLS